MFKKLLIATTLFVSVNSFAGNEETVKGQMISDAKDMCQLLVKETNLKVNMLECIHVVANDYYDASMYGALSGFDGTPLTQGEITSFAIKENDCPETSGNIVCLKSIENTAKWFTYGNLSVIDGDKWFIIKANEFFNAKMAQLEG